MPISALVILRCEDVQKKTGLPKSSLYELIKARQFPKPIQLTRRRVGWVESEIDQWIVDRINRRDQR